MDEQGELFESPDDHARAFSLDGDSISLRTLESGPGNLLTHNRQPSYDLLVPGDEHGRDDVCVLGSTDGSAKIMLRLMTGNCTWLAEYGSVGWCRACTDITDQPSIRNETSPDSIGYTTSLPQGLSVTSYNSSPPVQHAIMGPTFDDAVLAYPAAVDFMLGTNTDGAVDPSTQYPFPDCSGAAAKEKWWKCKGYGTSSCRIFPCVKTFNASMTAGNLTETLLATGTNWGTSNNNEKIMMLESHCINADERGSLENLGYKIKDDERWLAYNATFPLSTRPQFNNTFPESMMARQCIYAAEVTILLEIQNYIVWGLLNGTIFSSLDSLNPFSGPQAILTIFSSGDITFDRMNEIFTNISVAMTNYARGSNVSNISTPALGNMVQDKTCIAVRWPWLAFPLVLVLFTLIFFTCMILETRPAANRPGIWTTSPLALLYHGLSGKGGSAPNVPCTGIVRDLKGMEEPARSTTAKLSSPLDTVLHLEIQDGNPR